MSDLDKLMKKLKKDDPVDETAQTPVETPKVEDVPVKAPAQTPELPEKFEDDSDDDDDDVDEGEEKPIDHDPKQTFVENEVGILQNNGIFRRELLLIKKEQLDVLKVMAQLLIDIKKDGKIAK